MNEADFYPDRSARRHLLAQSVNAPKPEQTGVQAKDNKSDFGSAFGLLTSRNQPESFRAPDAGTYETYRKIGKHPTVALVRSGVVYPPVQSNSWTYSKRGTGRRAAHLTKDKIASNASQISDEWVAFVQDTIDPLRSEIVRNCLRSLEECWTPAETVWGRKGNRQVPVKFKPLLTDISKIIADENGNTIGISNKSPDDENPVELLGPNAFIYVNEPAPGNPYGVSRNENIREHWNQAMQTLTRLGQYMKKVATIIAQLHYPEGTSTDASGAPRPNQWIAQSILDSVNNGNSVAFINQFASQPDLTAALASAGQSSWVLSYLNPGSGDHSLGMLAVLQYYDQCFFNGWLRSARTGLESQHGSRADSKGHTDTGMIDASMIDQAIADAVSAQIIDPMLVLNFGPSAKGAVYIDPSPIEDDAQANLLKIIGPLLNHQEIGAWLFSLIDSVGFLDQMDVPILQSMRNAKFTPSPVSTNPPLAGLTSNGNQKNPRALQNGQPPQNGQDQVQQNGKSPFEDRFRQMFEKVTRRGK